LLNNHHHPDAGDPLNEIWISRIVDAKQIRSPKNLHDSLANLCELFAATVGEDDVKLFKHHVREDKRFKGLIVEIPVSSDITYEWSHKNLDAGVTNGRQAAIEAYQEYLNAGGEKRRYGELKVIGEERTKQKQREITEARRAQNSRS
jgi:hypothetical protein